MQSNSIYHAVKGTVKETSLFKLVIKHKYSRGRFDRLKKILFFSEKD